MSSSIFFFLLFKEPVALPVGVQLVVMAVLIGFKSGGKKKKKNRISAQCRHISQFNGNMKLFMFESFQ